MKDEIDYTKNERVAELVDRYDNGNKRAFGRRVGQLSQTISGIVLKKTTVTLDVVESIISNIPEVKRDWLLHGVKEEDKEDNFKSKNTEEMERRIKELESRLADKEEIIKGKNETIETKDALIKILIDGTVKGKFKSGS